MASSNQQPAPLTDWASIPAILATGPTVTQDFPIVGRNHPKYSFYHPTEGRRLSWPIMDLLASFIGQLHHSQKNWPAISLMWSRNNRGSVSLYQNLESSVWNFATDQQQSSEAWRNSRGAIPSYQNTVHSSSSLSHTTSSAGQLPTLHYGQSLVCSLLLHILRVYRFGLCIFIVSGWWLALAITSLVTSMMLLCIVQG